MDPSDPISPDDFVVLFTRHERQLRAFIRTLTPSWHDADEIVQEVALVAWRKFDEFEPGTSFISWTCMIARFKAMSYRRKLATDRLYFTDRLIETMADEGLDELEDRQAEYLALERCLKTLSESQRRLIRVAYAREGSIKEEAERTGLRPGTLYMRLSRIRAVLFDCMGKRLPQT